MIGWKLYMEQLFVRNPIILPVLPVLFFFLHNLTAFRELIYTPSVLLLFLIYILLAILIYKIFIIIFKLTPTQAAASGLVSIICFLFFGIFQDFLFNSKQLHPFSNTFFLLFIFWGLIGFLIFLSRKKHFLFIKFNLFTGILFLLLSVYEFGLFTLKMYSGKSFNSITKNMREPVDIDNKLTDHIRPDIYHIVFDCYTNRPAFNHYWKYNNEIYSFLDSMGFYTADSATSNYKTTPFSISSIFNLQYLKGTNDYLVSNSSNFLVGRKTYQNNLLFNFLTKKGYTFSIFSQMHNEEYLTKFGFLGVEKQANWLRKQTLERIYLNPWIIKKFITYFGGEKKQPAIIIKSMANFREYNAKALEHILTDSKNSYALGNSPPHFNYTHFMVPHDPYQVDENGKTIPSAKPGGNDMDGYLKQVKYANKIIKEITQILLQDSSRKKIIIIQGDHGYRHYADAPAKEPYSTLNAIYFYNKNYNSLYETISLVNTYRVILNNHFSGKLHLLRDSIIGISTNTTDN